jgi:endoglucanase
MTNPKKLTYLLSIGLLVAVLVASAPMLASAMPQSNLDPGTQFYVPKPNAGATQQIASLIANHNTADANLIRRMIKMPQAVWFTQGTPDSVKQDVMKTMERAADQAAVPVLVAYNVPGRDCSQYSAGGAPTGDDYKAWIDGFAAGLGKYKAVVLLEPDGLALLPTDCGQPDTYDRVSLIDYAAHKIASSDPNASVYLDAGHSAWHAVGDIAARLVAGGVQDIQGFFQNVSNYQFTSNSVEYGNWISSCIAYATAVNPGDFGGCPNQYWNGGPDTGWNGTAMDNYQEWKNEPYSGNPNDLAWNTVGIDSRYALILGSTVPTAHFVIDTSRNGVGPWPGIAEHPASDGATQDWCNPPDRGLGMRPTANTGISLVDAYLWIKIPGESDGQCYRWTSGPLDPVRNMQDPAAGQWFPEMALELVHNANPPLR